MKFKLILFFFFLTALRAETPEEIRIYLSTTSPLEPLYLGKFQCSDNSLTDGYLSQLESVLLFDLNHNGSTKVAPFNEQREKMTLHGTNWKNSGLLYVIQGKILEKKLSTLIFSVQSGSLKQFPEIVLSGDLSKDRKLIHRLADGIYKTLYGREGVASTQILYSSKQKTQNKWISEIWVCDWDGGNDQQLTSDGSYCVNPVAIPSSQKYGNDYFLYVSYKMGQPKIFISSKKGGGKRLIDLKGNQLLPAISPQRDKIAFICDASGRTDLFLQEFHPDKSFAKKPVQLFSYPSSTQASPTFSPDGTKLAFVSDKDGSPRIYLISATFTSKRPEPTLISKQNHENSCPSWSPDGKKLAYSAKTKGIRQIWIYDFETKEEWQLTDGKGNKENPSWAPDSRNLVFNSTDGQISDLYIVNLNQGEAIKISGGAGIKHYPSWSGGR